jgi:two-component system sensor histidine kinase QseC
MGNIIREKNLDIALEDNETALVQADEPLLRLLITNLLDNAVKFTPPGGKIRATVALNNGMGYLSISDTGPGIPADQRVAVFQRFYRVDSPHVDGTGLGLAIALEIVERLRGSIQLKSVESGQGLLVEVSLPKA